jgi:hypothetical protein
VILEEAKSSRYLQRETIVEGVHAKEKNLNKKIKEGDAEDYS